MDGSSRSPVGAKAQPSGSAPLRIRREMADNPVASVVVALVDDYAWQSEAKSTNVSND